MENYNPLPIEDKWQSFFENNKIFKTKKISDKKFYCLEMFPYPSGNIHMGHVRNYTLGDVIANFKRLNGYNVLHPMGWDAFGLPAENAAIQNNLHPKDWTLKNISAMKLQLKRLGLSIDWDKEISTCDENYYKHQQILFSLFFKKGIAYKKESYVNWDPIDNTVLANEQVIDGKGWRSGAVIEKKKLSQWFLNITKYSDQLLSSLEKLKGLSNQIIMVESNENLGFAGGVNLGVSKSSGEIIGLLNSDAKCDKNWITAAVETFQEDKEIASVASKVLTWDGSAIDFVDGSLTWYGMGYKREALKPTEEIIDFKREVLFGTGSALFFKKNIFEEVGGFDERFFMFYEDVDLGWRLNLLGYKVIYEPKSIAFHKHHASIDKFGKYHENFLLERNALMSVYKNYEAASLDRVLPAAMALTVRRSITRGELNPDLLDIKNSKKSDSDDVTIKKDALTGLLAIDSLVEHLPSLSESRNKIQATRKRSAGEMVTSFRQA